MQAVVRPIAAPVRDIRLDSLRGLLLVCMTVNHLPSDLRFLTDQCFGVFSSAEGFVFLSGLLAGFVYTRRWHRDGPDGLRATILQRTRTIYGWHLLAYFGAFAVLATNSWITGTHSVTSPPLFSDNPVLAGILGPLLVYQPGLLDILPMYCVFVVLLPLVIGALEKGRRRLLLGLSFAVWAIVQFCPNYDGSTIAPPLNFGFFNLFAWQFVFISGVAIGHAKTKATAPLAPVRPGLLLPVIAGAVFFFCIQHRLIPSLWPDNIFGIMLNKPSLGPLRLGSFALAAYLIAVAGTRFPSLLAWRPMALLGRHSLPVMTAQCVLILGLLAHDNLFATSADRWAVTAFMLAALFAVAAACERRQKKVVVAAPFRTRQTPAFATTEAHEQARAA
ncbi:MAG TPA: OpgC domain-containing protein [Opitutaceae bacterium]|nr:OpgC domain-containing protein [Opitutaceae bacterium]